MKPIKDMVEFAQARIDGQRLVFSDGAEVKFVRTYARYEEWVAEGKIFIAERMLTLGDHEYPAPMTEAPAVGEIYWYFAPYEEDGFNFATWKNVPIEREWLKNGVAWETEEGVKAFVTAIRAFHSVKS